MTSQDLIYLRDVGSSIGFIDLLMHYDMCHGAVFCNPVQPLVCVRGLEPS